MLQLEEDLQRLQEHLARQGFDTSEVVFEKPARLAGVEALEGAMQRRLPPAFREALLTLSSHAHFDWHVPRGHEFPLPFKGSVCGELHWGIDFLRDYEEQRRMWVEEVFPNADHPADAVWREKLPFLSVANGDFLAIDLHPDRYEQIVYLSHEVSAGHGYVLADDFHDLLRRWVPLACVGPEDWQWLPLTTGKTSRLDPHCDNARRWRELLGLP